jgi:hypothetical protein
MSMTDSGTVDTHFSGMKNLPDRATPRVFNFEHQASIGIDSPGNSSGIGFILLYKHLPSVEQIQLTPFTFEWLESSRLECCDAVQKVFQ